MNTTGNKFGEETCKDIHGQFTKAVDCLELKFININPKKYQEYEKTHNLDYRSLMPTNLFGYGDNYHPNNSCLLYTSPSPRD